MCIIFLFVTSFGCYLLAYTVDVISVVCISMGLVLKQRVQFLVDAE